MTFMKLGFRSLFRQKRRTAVTLLVITFGIGCLLLAQGHSLFINWGLRESTIHSETGHLQIYHQDFFDREEETALQYGLEDYERIRTDLMKMKDVKLVLARIDLMGLISNGDKSVACIGQAVEPEKEKQLRALFDINTPVYDSLIARSDEVQIIALGNGLAKSLNAKVGDYLTVMATTADGALNALDLKFVGTFSGFSPEYDERAIVIPLSAAQILLNTQKVKRLLVTLDQTERTDSYYQQISDLAKQNGYAISLKKWEDMAIYYKRVKTFYNQMVGFLSLVLFIIVFFSTANTIIMSIVERTTEIGTLLSLGTSKWQTLKMFFFEGLFIGIVGGVFAAIFALIGSTIINYFDILLAPAPGMTDGYPLSIRNEIGLYTQIFITTVFVAIVSTIVPALKVTKMKIVDALGHI
ncbi:MAG: ABC transporter permease [Candidatus Zhuqueibacterota bacterium]